MIDEDERPDEPEREQGANLAGDAGSADTGADTASQEGEAAAPGETADEPRDKPDATPPEERAESADTTDAAPAAEGTGAAGDAAGDEAVGDRQGPAAAAVDTAGAAVEASPGAEAGGPPAEAGPDETPSEPAAPRGKPRAGGRKRDRDADEAEGAEVIPGAHLEPDLVLEQPRDADADAYAKYAEAEAQLAGADPVAAEPVAAPEGEPAPAAEAEQAADAEVGDDVSDGAAAAPAERRTVDLAADARYIATGKRKTAIARVILKPGSGTFTLNGRELEEFFPRPGLQHTARQPLDATGYLTRMDVVARIHGGGVSSQAGALRHGIARALVEADPNLRSELKRRGFLTRDARAKERRKAGLKKARKKPQFSKR